MDKMDESKACGKGSPPLDNPSCSDRENEAHLTLKLCGTTFITMVQAADFRDLNDISRFQCLNWPWVRSVLVQGQMSPGIEIVPEVSLQRPSQMPLTEHNHVIDALSANASNDPFREWILPGTSCCRQHLLNAHSLNPISELATVDSVTVSYEISRRRVFWERFDDLLCRPFCRGMLGDIEMQHAATLMRQHNEYKQNSQLQCGNGEEV